MSGINEMNITKNKKIETVTVAGIDFIVLDRNESHALCLTKDFVYENTQFDGESNNYADSKIRQKLNTEFLAKLEEAVGAENILPMEIDLTSDDGLDDYGKVTDKVGLLTCEQYRKYNRIIEKFPVDDCWWLATPWSTPYRGYKYAVRCVYYYGTLDRFNCFIDRGVRPGCIFSSSIFKS